MVYSTSKVWSVSAVSGRQRKTDPAGPEKKKSKLGHKANSDIKRSTKRRLQGAHNKSNMKNNNSNNINIVTRSLALLLATVGRGSSSLAASEENPSLHQIVVRAGQHERCSFNSLVAHSHPHGWLILILFRLTSLHL